MENIKNDPIKKQNIDFNKTPLFKNVLNLIGTLQDTNSIKMLSIKNKSKNNPIEKQNIDFDKTSLSGNILNLIKTP